MREYILGKEVREYLPPLVNKFCCCLFLCVPAMYNNYIDRKRAYKTGFSSFTRALCETDFFKV